MKTLMKIIETIISLPITFVLGIVLGAFYTVVNPFYLFGKVFDDIWRGKNEQISNN